MDSQAWNERPFDLLRQRLGMQDHVRCRSKTSLGTRVLVLWAAGGFNKLCTRVSNEGFATQGQREDELQGYSASGSKQNVSCIGLVRFCNGSARPPCFLHCFASWSMLVMRIPTLQQSFSASSLTTPASSGMHDPSQLRPTHYRGPLGPGTSTESLPQRVSVPAFGLNQRENLQGLHIEPCEHHHSWATMLRIF